MPNSELYTNQAYEKASLLNLNRLNKLSMAKFMFKFKNNKLPKSFENFFRTRPEEQRYLLRNRIKEDYVCEWGKTIYGMKRLQYEGVQLWNDISPELRNLNSFVEFKKKYKVALLE